jgi:hypothetical protein
MILTPDQLQQVNEGKKTMHRLPATARDCRYREGHAYTVRTSDRSGSAKVTVMAEPRRERLGDIPPADAIREGHRHTRAFFDHWTETHGKLDLDQEVDVVLFLKGDHRDVDRYLARGGPAQTCNAMIDDPDRPGKKRRCGAAFSDDPEPQRVCRCGARRRDVGMDDIGYTTSSRRGLPGEPPAVPSDVQDAQTADANARQSHADWQPFHGPAERISGELPGMRATLAEMRARLDGHPDKQLKRELERMERGHALMEKALQRVRERLADAA